MTGIPDKGKPGKKNLNLSPLTRRVAENGILTALALVLSALEMAVPPLPMLPPGAKLGLSNIVTMYAAGSIGLVPAICIAVAKGLFSGLMRGFTAMLMSLSGGVASTFLMWLLLRLPKKPFGMVGLGVAGALAHNGAQLLVAALMTTPAILYYVPWLILFGVASGTLTGMVLRILMPLCTKFRL
jgi:heptaprenyl diphosphate synthase